MALAGMYTWCRRCRSPPELNSAPQFCTVTLWWKGELQRALIESHWGRFETAPLIFTLTVTNPVHALPFIYHQRSLTHHIDSCTTTQTVAHHLKIQFPSSIGTDVTQLITLITLTPENSHTITITQSHTLYKPWTSSCSLPSIVCAYRYPSR